ncbi:Transcriptional activator protein Anr [compost metagenome]
MNRRDIGNYLGMSMETVSRLFARFRDMNLVDSSGQDSHLLNIQALCEQGRPSDEGNL